jgi:hypothetical protein
MTDKTLVAWMYVRDSQGIQAWNEMGSFNVGNGTPSNVSLSPNSGFVYGNAYKILTAKYRDPDGADDLSECKLMLTQSGYPVSSGSEEPWNCGAARYDVYENKLYIRNYYGYWEGGYAPGSSYVMDSYYCTIDCNLTTVVKSGTDITIGWNVMIKPPLSGNSVVASMYCEDQNGFYDGYEQMGLFLVSVTPQTGTVSVLANLPTDPAQVTADYSDADGYLDITSCQLILNTSLVKTNAIYLWYDQVNDRIYLRNDANTAWLGGYHPGAYNKVVENSQCKLLCSSTYVWPYYGSPNMTVIWGIQLKPAMVGKNLIAYSWVKDKAGLTSPWDNRGTLHITSSMPRNLGVIPWRGIVPTSVKTVVKSGYWDNDGATDLTKCGLLISDSGITSVNQIELAYGPATNKIFLRNDAATAWLSATLGSATVLQNSQCKVYCAETTKTVAGDKLTMNWKIEFKPSMAGKDIGCYELVDDVSANEAGWDYKGGFAINAIPTTLLPDTFGGTVHAMVPYAYYGIYFDDNGSDDLAECWLLVNTVVNAGTSGLVRYNPVLNKLYVWDTVNAKWIGGCAPGSSNYLESAYCILDCAYTGVYRGTNYIQVNWVLYLKPTLVGTGRHAFTYASDKLGTTSGWTSWANFNVVP